MDQQVYNGLAKVREGLLFGIIIALLAFIGLVGLFASVILGVVILLLSFLLGILALMRLYTGFSTLQPYVPNMNLGKIGSILLIIPFLDIIGIIFVGIAIYSIGDKFNEANIKIGGILGAIPIGIIAFIGYILAYVGLGNLLNRQIPLPSQFQQPIQQYQGILRGNVANITLPYNSQVIILRAVLEEFNLQAINIQPTLLNPGDNYLTITFPMLPSNLLPGSIYRIRIELNNGQVIYVNVTYQA
ncbi:DUF973 family protein [Sulfolobus tengchongensis]|uniref:DUF973 family protein n=1 Tax=Sulfolobus tengchongensis TaxID=207809 RepID=A0AAX4L3Y1_9CREN